MPKPVTVFYDPAADPKVSVAPPTVHIPKGGSPIIFSPDPTSKIEFSVVNVELTPKESWKGGPSKNDKSYTLDDPGTPAGTFTYIVTILLADGTTVVGPRGGTGHEGPPIIMNEG
jgi:hypothetical protein